MTDKPAVAAAKEIATILGSFRADHYTDAVIAIISRHYAPRLEAAEKMEKALEQVVLGDFRIKPAAAALAAWKASQ